MGQDWTLYYNPGCGTCLRVRDRLASFGVNPRVVEYLKTPPTPETIDRLLKKMGAGPAVITRFQEPYWQEKGLNPETLDRKDWIKILSENPFLIQRPIVETPRRALVARPAEEIDTLFSPQ
ncbi:MAG: arsenate reductase (glutaredoxin) [Elusimicrobia bacterium]|jgi:arsenate reductase|nr:arsenate reductase (glutaredoxin) [Elusimicrobiota bacterium]MBK7545936.1 arsenate reductase (glutaredoxin) [Elusimicrobiota bacterium]MBK7574812.1 arsenate reductase (glutaredoxin) [Elusimicrobiota bacterium]MBK7687537.1 arsenate reductase (glutaredoxin) [Elusimicrobiota bacterium]MBK8423167.1 arsenate reductase (glutaredoxin) [Elusimicrobiota bacterium]